MRLLLRPKAQMITLKNATRWAIHGVSRNAMSSKKEYFYLRRQHETVFAEKWALHSAESQECEFVDEEPADDRRPLRDAQ